MIFVSWCGRLCNTEYTIEWNTYLHCSGSSQRTDLCLGKCFLHNNHHNTYSLLIFLSDDMPTSVGPICVQACVFVWLCECVYHNVSIDPNTCVRPYLFIFTYLFGCICPCAYVYKFVCVCVSCSVHTSTCIFTSVSEVDWLCVREWVRDRDREKDRVRERKQACDNMYSCFLQFVFFLSSLVV